MKPCTKSSSKLGISPRTTLLMNGRRYQDSSVAKVEMWRRDAGRRSDVDHPELNTCWAPRLAPSRSSRLQFPDGMAPRLVAVVGSEVTATSSDAAAASEYRGSRSWVDSDGDTLARGVRDIGTIDGTPRESRVVVPHNPVRWTLANTGSLLSAILLRSRGRVDIVRFVHWHEGVTTHPAARRSARLAPADPNLNARVRRRCWISVTGGKSTRFFTGFARR
jgi:hypothetical protein